MRSLTNRLALLFAAIVLAVLLVVYLYVVPPLQSSLRDQQLKSLADAAERYSGPIMRAIERRDSSAASMLMGAHIEKAKHRLLERMAADPKPDIGKG